MTTHDGRRRDYACPVCGFYGAGCVCIKGHTDECNTVGNGLCICHTPDEVPPEPSKLIILLPEHSPLTYEEQEEDFHTTLAYDNLDSEDRHYLLSAIRLFLAGKGSTIDMDALNRDLQVKSIERSFNRLKKELDEIG